MSEKLTKTAHFEDCGQRLDKWLASWTELSRARVKAMLEEGRVSVNGKIEKKPRAAILEEGEYIVDLPPPVKDRPEPEDIPLDIVFEDDDLLVVNKPTGMTVHPAPGLYNGTLVNALLFHCAGSLSGIGGVARPGIVHRIDKDTSGLLVVAKSNEAHQGLSKQFADHSAEREYVCFVRSAPKPRRGQIDTRIARSKGDRKKMAVIQMRTAEQIRRFGELPESEHGKQAITNYETIITYGQQPRAAVGTPLVSKVICRLETGRTHQIRVHMGHIGCPLLGDPVYGKGRGFPGSGEVLGGLKRQALHAKTLGFVHPVTGERLSFDSELPEDLQGLETRLLAI